MKDIVIPGRSITREFRVAAGCLVFVLGLSAYASIRFETAWSELGTTWPVMLGVAVAAYLLFGIFRGFVWLGFRLFRRR